MKTPLVTTTIGAFPKPSYVPVQDWFDLARETGGMNTAATTRQYSKDVEKNKTAHEQLFIRAAREVLKVHFGLVNASSSATSSEGCCTL